MCGVSRYRRSQRRLHDRTPTHRRAWHYHRIMVSHVLDDANTEALDPRRRARPTVLRGNSRCLQTRHVLEPRMTRRKIISYAAKAEVLAATIHLLTDHSPEVWKKVP